jgi:hypothetical protein
MTLTEFLLARIAEDEAKAQECLPFVSEGRFIDITLTRWDNETDESWTKHVRPYDPRVSLRECEAKRRIVERHTPQWTLGGTAQSCFTCRAKDNSGGWHPAPCPTLLDLVAIYADHPDFDPAWTV